MKLRPYQIDAKNKIYDAWASGAVNVLVQLHTGAGKTVLFSNIIAENQGVSFAIAHRMELVSQISLTLARYGIRHNIIAQKNTVRAIIAIHMSELKYSFYDPQSRVTVAGIDTLLRLNPIPAWFKNVNLIVQDEGHHPLKENKWGRAAALFPHAKGLYPTATPLRADGCGLGRHADGIIDALIGGPSMQDLMRGGYLTPYRIFAPPSDLDLSAVNVSASGDFSPPKLRTAVHKSHITGDVVSHYLKIASGKLGVTFAVDIEAAIEIAKTFKSQGVNAEVISSKTPDVLRNMIMSKFRKREILQLVNVDLLGEGVDVPAIEVVSMARPTQSYGLYSQQFGRALRPMQGKTHAIIIDHVGNVIRHGLPDSAKEWTLERRERRSRVTPDDVVPLRTCLNEGCLSVYERIHRVCPYCGFHTPPLQRSSPTYVDGDLLELDEETLAKLRGEIKRIDDVPRIPQNLDTFAQRAVYNRHMERQEAQVFLRESIAVWAGHHKVLNRDDSEIYRRFYFSFGIDIATAQTLNAKDAQELKNRIEVNLVKEKFVL